jgi:hypothetical protein
LEEAWKALVFLVALCERGSVWIGNAVAVALVKDGVGVEPVDSTDVDSVLAKAKQLVDNLPSLLRPEVFQ